MAIDPVPVVDPVLLVEDEPAMVLRVDLSNGTAVERYVALTEDELAVRQRDESDYQTKEAERAAAASTRQAFLDELRAGKASDAAVQSALADLLEGAPIR